MAEHGVKMCKQLLKKCHSNWYNFRKALHEFRNTPRVDGISPSQMVFGRRQKGVLPCLPSAYETIDQNSALEGRRHMKQIQKLNYDKHAKELPKLEIGQSVYLQNPFNRTWDSHGIIKNIRSNGRSYEVENSDGKIYLRNRRFLRAKKAFETSFDHESEECADQPKGILRRSERLKQKKSVTIKSPENSALALSI